MDCFDADVLIYAIIAEHPLGARVRTLFQDQDGPVGVGSTILLPELLSKPTRLGHSAQLTELRQLLMRLELRAVDRAVAEYAVELGAKYGLRAPDALHLATAVVVAADRFITNNRRDFGAQIAEVDVVYPDELG